jgi:hypothetical protein
MVTLLTHGPTGTCHKWGATGYMAFRGVEGIEVDLLDGLELIRGKDNAFLVQCSAHLLAHKVTERRWSEDFVVDTFIHPRKAPEVPRPRKAEQPKTLGLVPATGGYVDLPAWNEVVDIQSKPIVAESLSPDATRRASPTSSTSPPIRTSSRSSERSAKSTRLGWSTEPRCASKAM